MKARTLSTSTILFSIFIILANSTIAVAQNADKAKEVDKEEIEVRKFVDSFLKELEESKDIDQVPKSYFVSDFQKRFAERDTLSELDEKLFENMEFEERYQLNRLVFNVLYSAVVHVIAKTNMFDEDETDGSYPFSINNMFSPEIVGLMRNSKILRAMYFQQSDDDFSFKSVEQLHDFMIELRDVNFAQIASINDWSKEQKTVYEKNLSEFVEAAYWYKSEICEKDCDGFAEQGRRFHTRGYPLEFGIVRENGALKIYNVYFAVED